MILFNNLNFLTIFFYCDVPESWQVNLQYPASTSLEGMITFTEYLMFLFTHESFLEIYWTILSALILLFSVLGNFSDTSLWCDESLLSSIATAGATLFRFKNFCAGVEKIQAFFASIITSEVIDNFSTFCKSFLFQSALRIVLLFIGMGIAFYPVLRLIARQSKPQINAFIFCNSTYYASLWDFQKTLTRLCLYKWVPDAKIIAQVLYLPILTWIGVGIFFIVLGVTILVLEPQIWGEWVNSVFGSTGLKIPKEASHEILSLNTNSVSSEEMAKCPPPELHFWHVVIIGAVSLLILAVQANS